MEPKTLIARPGEEIVVRRSTPDVLELEATFSPSPHRPPGHFHPRQDERFTVLEGAMAVDIGGDQRVVPTGESFEVARGTVHSMRPHGDEPARVRWEVRPALRTEAFFEALDAINRSGRVNRDGMPKPLVAARVLNAFSDEFRLADIPASLHRPLFAGLAGVARLLSVGWTTSTESRSSSTTSAPITGGS